MAYGFSISFDVEIDAQYGVPFLRKGRSPRAHVCLGYSRAFLFQIIGARNAEDLERQTQTRRDNRSRNSEADYYHLRRLQGRKVQCSVTADGPGVLDSNGEHASLLRLPADRRS